MLRSHRAVGGRSCAPPSLLHTGAGAVCRVLGPELWVVAGLLIDADNPHPPSPEVGGLLWASMWAGPGLACSTLTAVSSSLSSDSVLRRTAGSPPPPQAAGTAQGCSYRGNGKAVDLRLQCA
ncbi:hypothetical protein AAFF_G00207350 [Aldrovandia affinis]|uniref:Uncharacterized protein n=1 Tax=Aldrovandia affinis TaxID=143900 RepID=A0AAD7RHG5_9TELE|nr:hypothetical protein AAFF_G00207350 [Aldrovandia affinis]